MSYSSGLLFQESKAQQEKARVAHSPTLPQPLFLLQERDVSHPQGPPPTPQGGALLCVWHSSCTALHPPSNKHGSVWTWCGSFPLKAGEMDAETWGWRRLYWGCRRGPWTVRMEGLLVRGCHWPWTLGLSVWKGLRMRMMSRPDWLASLVASCTISSLVLLAMSSSRTVPFTAAERGGQARIPPLCSFRGAAADPHPTAAAPAPSAPGRGSTEPGQAARPPSPSPPQGPQHSQYSARSTGAGAGPEWGLT